MIDKDPDCIDDDDGTDSKDDPTIHHIARAVSHKDEGNNVSAGYCIVYLPVTDFRTMYVYLPVKE